MSLLEKVVEKKSSFLRGVTQECKLLGHPNPQEKWVSSSSVFNTCYELALLQRAKLFTITPPH